MSKGRSPTMRHVSRTHRFDLDRLYDRIILNSMFQIKSPAGRHPHKRIIHRRQMDTTDTTGQHHDALHIYLFKAILSVSSAVVNAFFTSMSKRVGESYAASASAKQKPVHDREEN